MFIKEIIIEGFKSYRERTVLGPLDPGLNLVVGRNGAGKSNFFCAVEVIFSKQEHNAVMFVETDVDLYVNRLMQLLMGNVRFYELFTIIAVLLVV